MEELLVRKIEAGIRGIRLGTKKPSEVDIDKFFTRLEKINEYLCDDLKMKYDNVKSDYKKKLQSA